MVLCRSHHCPRGRRSRISRMASAVSKARQPRLRASRGAGQGHPRLYIFSSGTSGRSYCIHSFRGDRRLCSPPRSQAPHPLVLGRCGPRPLFDLCLVACGPREQLGTPGSAFLRHVYNPVSPRGLDRPETKNLVAHRRLTCRWSGLRPLERQVRRRDTMGQRGGQSRSTWSLDAVARTRRTVRAQPNAVASAAAWAWRLASTAERILPGSDGFGGRPSVGALLAGSSHISTPGRDQNGECLTVSFRETCVVVAAKCLRRREVNATRGRPRHPLWGGRGSSWRGRESRRSGWPARGRPREPVSKSQRHLTCRWSGLRPLVCRVIPCAARRSKPLNSDVRRPDHEHHPRHHRLPCHCHWLHLGDAPTKDPGERLFSDDSGDSGRSDNRIFRSPGHHKSLQSGMVWTVRLPFRVSRVERRNHRFKGFWDRASGRTRSNRRSPRFSTGGIGFSSGIPGGSQPHEA